MQVITDPGATPANLTSAGSVLTIGAFDGVHRGHLAVIAKVKAIAEARGLASAVVTFDRHPAAVVRPASAPPLLTDLAQKLELLDAAGIDLTLVVRFDKARSEESAQDFVAEVLVTRLAPRSVVVGADFHFGHGRRGDVALLREMGKGLGFEVVGLDLLTEAAVTGAAVDGAVLDGAVSSTRIRRLLAAGQVAGAAALLGRPHQVRGTVTHGDHRGGPLLGCPTANVSVAEDIARPADGIYAGVYQRPGGGVHPAAISVGRRPTFYADAPRLVEAHLIDFSGDLYDEAAKVSFVERLRSERPFDSVDELAEQMRADVVRARAVLAGSAGLSGWS